MLIKKIEKPARQQICPPNKTFVIKVNDISKARLDQIVPTITHQENFDRALTYAK